LFRDFVGAAFERMLAQAGRIPELQSDHTTVVLPAG
jgi:hypothetical protein